MQTGLERLRARWQLWIAVLRLCRSELWVRFALARYCLAIYRRELLEHKLEAATMEADAWRGEASAHESCWENDAESVSLAGPETADAAAGVLGIRWRIWSRLSVVSWLLLIPASWTWVFLIRGGMEVLSFGLFFLWLGVAVSWSGVPGAAALLNRVVRERLLYLPEAAALACLTLSAVMGLCGGFLAMCLHPEMGVGTALSGIFFGILLVFPLVVPLVCCMTVWRVAKRHGRIPRMGYALLTGVSAVGWMGASLIGPVAGSGGT